MSAITDYEDLTSYYLDDADLAHLVDTAGECVLNWSTKDGWPVGVVHAYVPGDAGTIWMTCAARRKRVSAIKRDNRVSVVINGTGAGLNGKTVTYKGTCVIHEHGQPGWEETKEWFYTALSARVSPTSPEFQATFHRFLDSPERVILEVTPTWKLTYDGAKMMGATMLAEGSAGEQPPRTTPDR